MDFCLVVFASATTVNRVKSVLLKKFQINSEIVQTPKAIPAKGCSYSLKIKTEYADVVWNLIKENGLSSKGIFRESNFEKIK
ncbi:MAG: DUF3343 domain-containing protein [Clostridia bacterium]|nr:DUF3343 domain-containing protein [Clostridia bacterium]